jgi:hypothetical protein
MDFGLIISDVIRCRHIQSKEKHNKQVELEEFDLWSKNMFHYKRDVLE